MIECTIGTCSYGRIYVPSKLAKSPLMCIAENPSWREVQEGEPLVGPAGKKFNTILSRVGLTRSDISLCNLCNCMDTTREKKNPIAEEIDRCSPRLMAEINQVDPRVIILLGQLATSQFYTGIATSFANLRGKPRTWNGRILVPTYHPARALPHRNPESEELIYEDFLLARSLLPQEPVV